MTSLLHGRHFTINNRRCFHALRVEPLECRHLLAGDTLLISEFMASNTTVLMDEDGNSSDWIEIHNSTDEAIRAYGWYLTDRDDVLDRWRIPDVIISAGAYFVVFASGVNRVSGQLHTNFKLDASGEYLALVRPDLTVAHEYGPTYSVQTNDMSYGLDEATGTVGYLASATPGSMNSSLRGGLVEFSHPSSTFIEPFFLTVAADSGGPQIRYTSDGSSPTNESLLYTGLIEITKTTQIRASAVSISGALGPVSSVSFVQLDEDVRNFNSNLPIVVLENFDGGRFRSNLITPAFMAIFEPDQTGRSSLAQRANVTTRASVKIRGASTNNQPKPNYSVEMWDETDDDRAIPMLGMPANADWVFYAPHDIDLTLIRNAVAFELSNQMGHYAPRTRFVEVFTNTGGGPLSADDYHGIYVVMEKIKRGLNRVNVVDLPPGVTTEPDITGGYIFKIDLPDPGDRGWRTQRDKDRYLHVFPKEQEMPPEQRDHIRTFIDDFENVLYGPNFRDSELGYRRFFDVQAAIDQHILQLLSKDGDALVRSTYLHKDRGGKIVFGPPWDFDRAFGFGTSGSPVGWNLSHWSFRWWKRLFEDPDFMQRWIDRYAELREKIFTEDNLARIIDRMVAQLGEAVPRNFERWPVLPTDGDGWEGEITRTKQWLAERIQWMDSRFAAAPKAMPNGGAWLPGQPISLSAGSGDVFYTMDGRDPRLPGGEVSHGTLRLGREETYVNASSSARYLLPRGIASEVSWQETQFTDDFWNSGVAAIGYDSGTSDIGIRTESGFTVRELQAKLTVETLETADLLLDASDSLIESQTTVMDVPVIDFVDDKGNSARFDRDNSFPNGGGDNTIVHATAALVVDADATYTFGVSTGDGARLKVDDVDVIVDPGRVGSSEQFGTISLAAGSHSLELLMYDKDGRTRLELSVAPGEHLSFNEADFQLLGENVNFTPLIQTDVRTLMQDVNSSLYVRIPFNAFQTADVKRLLLSMQYDDGFVAYLNGVEVARRNSPDVLDYQSAATAWRPDQAATLREEIDLSGFKHQLREGNNVLVIHGLNVAEDNGKFLLVPELRVTLEGHPFQLPGPTTITARVKDDLGLRFGDKERSPWSAPITIAFTEQVIADPSNLRITELNYNPYGVRLGQSDVNADTFEFIELMNVGAEPIDLAGVQFVRGVTFTFASQILQPGERIVVVEDVDAFRSRYGNTVRIGVGNDGQGSGNGEYGGKLDNGGEAVKLVDRSGRTIQQFRYDDLPPWNSRADGTGNTLEIIDALDVANDPYNWAVSVRLGGTPGRGPTLFGDFTNDGTIDADDIDMLFREVTSGTHESEFDLNQDAYVDKADVDELVQNILHTQLGDANLDRRVNTDDFMTLAQNFGLPQDVGWKTGDFDGDGVVSFRDFVTLTNHIDLV